MSARNRFGRYRDLWSRLCVIGVRLTGLSETGRRESPEYHAAEAEYAAVLGRIRAAQAGRAARA